MHKTDLVTFNSRSRPAQALAGKNLSSLQTDCFIYITFPSFLCYLSSISFTSPLHFLLNQSISILGLIDLFLSLFLGLSSFFLSFWENIDSGVAYIRGKERCLWQKGEKAFFFFIWRAEMGRLYLVNLEGKIYSCKHCQTHLALYEEIVSKVINRLLLRICCYKWFLWWFAAWVFLYFSLIECFMMWVLCCCWNYENPFGFISFHMFLLDNLGTWFSKWMGFGAFWDVWRNSWVR